MKTVSGTATIQVTINIPISGGSFTGRETLEQMFETCKRQAIDKLENMLGPHGGRIMEPPTVEIHLMEKEE